MELLIKDPASYQKIVTAFKKHKTGLSLQDVSAQTGLSLAKVKELLPLAADEYSARLEVTESGEILYTFPQGTRSRYRGFRAVLRKSLFFVSQNALKALALLFKVWIMVMLIGYFVLFLVIALGTLVISASANSNRRRGGGNASMGLFNMFIRLWFYSELMGASRRRGSSWSSLPQAGNREKKNPLHHRIFSFIFGDKDPNGDREEELKKAFIAFVRNNRGIISLPELMILSTLPPQEAETLMMELCAEFGGSPEVSGQGTLVYRFEEIMLSGTAPENPPALGTISAFYKKLESFSQNPAGMNTWFALINGLNLIFGVYFLYNSINVGSLIQEPGMYSNFYIILAQGGIDPLFFIQVVLGIVPLLFSALFWIIPALRSWLLSRKNESHRVDNFRSFCINRIWRTPEAFNAEGALPANDECHPRNLDKGRARVLKDISAYWMPEITIGENQKEVFSFLNLKFEKEALQAYRSGSGPARDLGGIVFDSAAPLGPTPTIDQEAETHE